MEHDEAVCPCLPEITPVFMQKGEEIATSLRLLALVMSMSIVFPWLDGKRRQHMHLFCMHWMSGVVYVVSQFVMSVMVLLCWSKSGAEPFIYILKFTELTALNVWSISSVAIALLIVSIVRAFERCRRVPAVIGSRKVLWGVFIVSVLQTMSSVCVWGKLLVTGAYYWVTSENERKKEWITLSFAIVQLVAGIVMLVLLAYIVTTSRLSSLIVCCRTSKRVRYYLYLTIMGTAMYVYSGVSLVIHRFTESGIRKDLVMVGWCFKYVHVVLDTLILIGVLAAQQRHEREQLPTTRAASSAIVGINGSCIRRSTSGGHDDAKGKRETRKVIAPKDVSKAGGSSSRVFPQRDVKVVGDARANRTGRSPSAAAPVVTSSTASATSGGDSSTP